MTSLKNLNSHPFQYNKKLDQILKLNMHNIPSTINVIYSYKVMHFLIFENNVLASATFNIFSTYFNQTKRILMSAA